MDGLRNEFFSGTGFALDEHSRVCGRNLLNLIKHRFESSAIPDDSFKRALDLI
jgi:hypothetical protein